MQVACVNVNGHNRRRVDSHLQPLACSLGRDDAARDADELRDAKDFIAHGVEEGAEVAVVLHAARGARRRHRAVQSVERVVEHRDSHRAGPTISHHAHVFALEAKLEI